MENEIQEILKILKSMLGMHRQLLETVRHERIALVEANLKEIQETTLSKQTIIGFIAKAESERLAAVGRLAQMLRINPSELNLSEIAIRVQGKDQKLADQIRSVQTSLQILINRIREQNKDNRVFIERSLEHVQNMKMNVLGEAQPHTETYTQNGQRAQRSSGARLLSKEA